MILASIDTRTGDTVLFGLPRNLQRVPFPQGSPGARQYPDGFWCPSQQCLLNALWQYGVEHASDPYYRDSELHNPGLQATIDGVQEVTGLTVDQYFLLDLRGFSSFVNAIGGIDIKVVRPIPIGGHENQFGRQVGVKGYIQPGLQHLDGYHALWYARSRSDSSDYDRMQRQRCVIGAVAQQANPLALARAFPQIARAIQKDMSTSIPLDDFGSWATLALRVQKAQVRSLPFTAAVIDTAHPDFDKIRSLVQTALEPPAKKPRSNGSASGSGGTGTSGVRNPSQAVDVKSACG
jgi:LCP family protein required for cell wall assembly